MFSDEFDGTQLDAGKWKTELRWGRKNPPELQYYATDALEVGNGMLRIRAEQRKMDGMAYTSGVISTFDQFKFAFGYVEMRAKMPIGQGLWPAFWLLADDHRSPAEIDVMEYLGDEPQKVWTTLHYDDATDPSDMENRFWIGPDFSRDFHTFAMKWDPSTVTWYVDGVERFRVTDRVPTKPMYLIANMAVGGQWPGNPDANTAFPAYFDIDYIRVYQFN